MQMTSSSHSHTRARGQPINYTTIPTSFIFMDKTKQSHTKSRLNNLHSVTPGPAEYTSNLDLKIYNIALPMPRHPMVMGLTVDPKLTYTTLIHNISVHAHKPLQIIKVLPATGWGKQNETLMATYKTVMRPDLKRYFPASLVLNLPNSEKKPPFLKSYLHKVDAKSHPSPLCPLCNTHTHSHYTHSLQLHPLRTTLSTLDLWTDPDGVMELMARWRDKLAGGAKAG